MCSLSVRIPCWVCILFSNTSDALIAILPNLERHGHFPLLMIKLHLSFISKDVQIVFDKKYYVSSVVAAFFVGYLHRKSVVNTYHQSNQMWKRLPKQVIITQREKKGSFRMEKIKKILSLCQMQLYLNQSFQSERY